MMKWICYDDDNNNNNNNNNNNFLWIIIIANNIVFKTNLKTTKIDFLFFIFVNESSFSSYAHI